MKYISGIVVLLIIVGGIITYSTEELDTDATTEDIPSYNIKNRYECKQIQDDTEYNKCVMFYYEKAPYELGDILVPIRH